MVFSLLLLYTSKRFLSASLLKSSAKRVKPHTRSRSGNTYTVSLKKRREKNVVILYLFQNDVDVSLNTTNIYFQILLVNYNTV